MKVYPFITAEKPAERNIIRSCAVLSVSRSAYYEWARQIPSARSQEDERLRDRIGRIHTESRGTYGAPRVHQRLRQQGLRTARKRVARVMGGSWTLWPSEAAREANYHRRWLILRSW